MAKKSMIARENKRIKSIAKHKKVRAALKLKQKLPNADFSESMAAQYQLQKLPRNSSPVRHNKRCGICGRPRAVYRKFGLCRICLRETLMRGDVPGGRKASW